jgi:long-chain acyl-CoA synthetase
MTGYWKDEAQTAQAIDHDGWLHTGDLAEIREGRVFILGRLQDIQVLAIGEKINASLIEDEITKDRLFDQALVIGEGKPFLVAICTSTARDGDACKRARRRCRQSQRTAVMKSGASATAWPPQGPPRHARCKRSIWCSSHGPSSPDC